MTQKKSSFEEVLARLENANRYMKLPDHLYERLRHPKRSVTVSVPVAMDDGSVRFLPATASSTIPREARQRAG